MPFGGARHVDVVGFAVLNQLTDTIGELGQMAREFAVRKTELDDGIWFQVKTVGRPLQFVSPTYFERHRVGTQRVMGPPTSRCDDDSDGYTKSA
jgi:hypothetical protein